MSPSRFLGWEPAETHTTTHADGSTVTTVVTREPEWSDRDREAAWALWEEQQDRCPDCGRPTDVCGDPDAPWYTYRHVCYASAHRTKVQRQWDELTKDVKPGPDGYLPTDGVTVSAAPFEVNAADDFLDSRRLRRGLQRLPETPDPDGG